MSEYDEATCITAGELRAAGLEIDQKIPDCAWIPRWAVKIKVDKVTGDPEKGIMSASVQYEFTKSFTWFSAEFNVKMDS